MKRTRIEILEDNIVVANNHYRNGEPTITDDMYDNLLAQLKVLDPNHWVFKKGVIENAPSNPRKEELPHPMFSMDKLHTLREVREWLDSKDITSNVELILTYKYDGISNVVKEFTEQCWTRGDGVIGQRSDKHFKTLNTPAIKFDSQLITFGEAIISQENWKKYFEGKTSPKTGETYKINRNTVAGLFNRDEVSEELKHVDFVRYGANTPSLDKDEMLEMLNGLSDVKVPFFEVKAKDLTEEILNDFYNQGIKEYPIDGIIIDINDKYGRAELGREENMNPAYARAIKLPHWSDSADVVIKSHKFSMSKQGLLKGTVQFNPVTIKGAEVKQATFINAAFLTDFGLIKGSKIKVCTSGDIIPKIIEVEGIKIPFREYFKTQKAYDEAYEAATIAFSLKFPERVHQISDETTYCPCCGNPLKWNDTMKEKVCTDDQCKDIVIAKLVHFFKTIKMENFGEPTIISLFDAGYETIGDFLSMSEQDFVNIEGLGLKSYQTFKKQLDKYREEGLPLARMLYALDIFEGVIGEKLCQKILDERGDIWTPLSIQSIEGVSKKTSRVFCKAIENVHVYRIPFNSSYITTPKIEVNEGGKYEGWKVCFSGVRLKGEQKENFIKEGGKEVSGVSIKTTHLVLKDINSTSSKAVKAKKLGIKILSLNEL